MRTLHPPAGLDGAFRIHVLPEHLDQAGLRLGDLCEITDENGSAVGYGVAWRATDKMGTNPKVRPVKMSETLQAAYGIRASSQVMLYHTEAKVVPADEVVLTDVTPSQHLENAQQEDAANAAWRWRCGHALGELHEFADPVSHLIRVQPTATHSPAAPPLMSMRKRDFGSASTLIESSHPRPSLDRPTCTLSTITQSFPSTIQDRLLLQTL